MAASAERTRLRPRAADPGDHRDRARQAAPSSATSRSTWPTAPVARRPRRLIEGLLAPAFENRHAERDGRRRRVLRRRRRELAITTDSYVVKPLRFPGGSIGELAVNGTVNDLAVSGARPLALSLSLILEEGLSAEELRGRGAGDRRRRRRGRRADHRRRHQGGRARARRRDVHLHDRRRPARPPSAPLALGAAARRPDPALGRIGEHGTAIMLARDEFELDAEIESDTLLAVARRRRAARRGRARAALHARRHPRRRRLGAQRAGPRLGRGDDRPRGATIPVKPEVAGAAEILGIDPMYVANEGKLVAFVAPERGGRGAGRAAERARLRAGGRDRRGADGAARDGAGADELWRQAGDGSAGGRSAAADLLSETREETGWRRQAVHTRAEEDRGGHRPRPVDDHRAQLRGRLGGHDLGHQPEPRGHHPAGDPGHAEGRRPQPGGRLRRRRRSTPRPGSTPRRASSTRSCWCIEGSIGNEEINGEGHWTGFAVNPAERPADHDERVARPAGAEGGGRGRGRAPAPPTAGSRR